MYFNAETHEVENTGGSEIEAIVVEIKRYDSRGWRSPSLT